MIIFLKMNVSHNFGMSPKSVVQVHNLPPLPRRTLLGSRGDDRENQGTQSSHSSLVERSSMKVSVCERRLFDGFFCRGGMIVWGQ